MTLEEFEKMLSFHDWFYEYADGPAYYKGRESLGRIMDLIRENGEEFRKTYQEYKKRFKG